MIKLEPSLRGSRWREGRGHGQVSSGDTGQARRLAPPACWRNEIGETQLSEEAGEGPGAKPKTAFPGWGAL